VRQQRVSLTTSDNAIALPLCILHFAPAKGVKTFRAERVARQQYDRHADPVCMTGSLSKRIRVQQSQELVIKNVLLSRKRTGKFTTSGRLIGGLVAGKCYAGCDTTSKIIFRKT